MQSQDIQGIEYLDVLHTECNACILTEAHLCAQGDKTHSWSLFPLPFLPHYL